MEFLHKICRKTISLTSFVLIPFSTADFCKSFHLTSSFMSLFASASNANILASCVRLSAISCKPDFFLLTSMIWFATSYNSNLPIFAVFNFLNKTPRILSMQLYLIVEYLW